MNNFINILGEDKDTKALFVQANYGSITLDVIPSSINLLQTSKDYELLHMQDYMGHIVTFEKKLSLEEAVDKWINSVANNQSAPQENVEQASPIL